MPEHLMKTLNEFEMGRFGSSAGLDYERNCGEYLNLSIGFNFSESGYLARAYIATGSIWYYETYLVPVEVSYNRKIRIYAIPVHLSCNLINKKWFSSGLGLGIMPGFVKNRSEKCVGYCFSGNWYYEKETEAVSPFKKELVVWALAKFNARVIVRRWFIGLKGVFNVCLTPLYGKNDRYWSFDNDYALKRYLYNTGVGLETGVRF
jgi:hypothetical protein